MAKIYNVMQKKLSENKKIERKKKGKTQKKKELHIVNIHKFNSYELLSIFLRTQQQSSPIELPKMFNRHQALKGRKQGKGHIMKFREPCQINANHQVAHLQNVKIISTDQK